MIIDSKMQQSIVIGFNTQGVENFTLCILYLTKFKISKFELDLTNHSTIEALTNIGAICLFHILQNIIISYFISCSLGNGPLLASPLYLYT